ncbi:MAG: 3'-5' exonuclease [Pseudomonadota bacterium]
MSLTSNLIFDLETVPDPRFYFPPEAKTGTDRPIAPPWAQRPIAIGVLWLDYDYKFARLGIVGDKPDNERAALKDFAEFVGKNKPLLVTFNGRSFDLPVIALRCLLHGIPLPWYYKGRDYRYRYSDQGHLDLCDFLSEHGASQYLSLNTASQLIGLPGKLAVDGSQVETLYKAGQTEVINRYCLADVVQTAFLFLRFRLLQGVFSPETYRKVALDLYKELVKDGRLDELFANTDLDRLLLPVVE